MDSFLKQQEAGKVVDSSKSFTINRALSREKVLESIPRGPSTAVFRLLDAASEAWGFSSSDTILRVMATQGRNNHEFQIFARFPEATPAMKARLLDELRRPFGDWSGASLLARV